MHDLPLYPVAPGLRLRGDWVPNHFRRFLNSRFVATVDYAAGFAAVILWSAACDQDPVGTLPEDDVELARLAGFGRDIAAWERLREGALYGWRPCAVDQDGTLIRRLAHQTVTEVVVEAMSRMEKSRQKSEAGAERALLSRLRARMREAGASARLTEREDFVTAVLTQLRGGNLRWNSANVRAAMEDVQMRLDLGGGVADMPRAVGRGGGF
ncbi:DUF1376 domain-containing protein [Oceanicella sp. SM1341]|uniref:DUF1376 domain-containing protein n=1 Tax=Oceanicella sp. SM1341 TaxID=1548889 RepID=UPI000E4AAB03|nr:DUF1376 domain-containing protein [Oceanicella sp. SM1341]